MKDFRNEREFNLAATETKSIAHVPAKQPRDLLYIGAALVILSITLGGFAVVRLLIILTSAY